MSPRRLDLFRWGPVAVFLVLSFLPAGILAAAWLGPALSGDWAVLSWALPSGPGFRLLGSSFLLATAVTALSTALGTGLAIAMCGTGRWRDWLRSVYLLPLLIPPYIQALTWLAVFGRRQALDQGLAFLLGADRPVLAGYGFVPAALVLTFSFFPIVTLLVKAGFENIDRPIIEAAAVMRGPWPVAWRIILPLVSPSILAGAGLVMVLVLWEYGVPSVLQLNVYAMEIYASFSQYGDGARAMAASLPLLAAGTALLLCTQWPLRNSPLRREPGFRLSLHVSRWPPLARAFPRFCAIAWCLAVGLPVAVLVARGGSPAVLTDALVAAWREIALSAQVAAGSAMAAAAVAVPLAFAWARRSRYQGVQWLVCALPLAVPPPVIGVALILLWNQPVLDWAYGGPAPLIVAHAARFLPFALYAASSWMRHLDPALIEAAALYPVGWRRRLLWVHWPLASPAVALTSVVVFVLSLGELGTSLLAAPPGEATLPMRIYNLLHYGATDTVAALSLAMVVLGAVATLAVLALQPRV